MSPARLVRLNHAVLFVSDLSKAEEFYCGVMGMQIVSREPAFNALFLRLPESGNHHDLGLFGLGSSARPAPTGSVGLYHLAWQVDTIDDLAHAREALIESGSFRGESSHGATKSLYGVDPDNNQFEIMWMLPREAWGEYEDSAVVEPLNLDEEVNVWAGVKTAGTIQ